jgi:prepilin-type N-terminal cleavage/methylation domain-containing protein
MMSVRKGFTLLEIMIVVAVIALLALLLLPNLLGSRQAVQDQAIDTTLGKVMAAQELFQARCGAYYLNNTTAAGRCPVTVVPGEWARLYPVTAQDPTVTVTPQVATATGYCVEAFHQNDTARVWSIRSGTTFQGRPVQVNCQANPAP